jgi:hypothetical protein
MKRHFEERKPIMAIRRTGNTTTTSRSTAVKDFNSGRPAPNGVTGSPTQRTGSTVESKPTHDQIAKAAYFLWIEKGRPNGRDREIWAEAEKRLTRK